MLVVMVIAVGLMVDDGGNDDGDDGGDDTGDGYDGDYGDDDGDDTTLYSGDDDDGVVLVIVIIFHLTDIIFPGTFHASWNIAMATSILESYFFIK